MITAEELRNIDWNIITAISTAFMGLVILVAAIVAVRQLKEIRRSRQLDAFTNLIQFVQREDIREARAILMEELSKKDFTDWSKDEIKQAEKACHTYDSAGIMWLRKYIDRKLDVAKEWHDSIVKCWEAACPMITKYRGERGDDFWYYFEELYKKAKKHEEARKIKSGEQAEKE